MAFIGDLVRVMADVTGVPEPTVAQIARLVREAGFIASGGKGRSAAKMSARDCASLLVAVLINDQVKNAPRNLSWASSMCRYKVDMLAEFSQDTNLSVEISDISFIEDVATIIENLKNSGQLSECSIYIRFERPWWKAHINANQYFITAKDWGGEHVDYRSTSAIVGERVYNKGEIIDRVPGLRIETLVDEHVVSALADLIRG